MNYYRYIIIVCVLALMNIEAQAQLPDSVYCYLTRDINKFKRNFYSKTVYSYTTVLLIYNSSKDTVNIDGFSMLIPHVSSNYERDGFYWDYLTISNEEPKRDSVVTVFDLILTGMIIDGKLVKITELEKKKSIVIPPNSLFVSPISMLRHGGFDYLKEYYKLCLYYNKNVIAEMIVKYESNF